MDFPKQVIGMVESMSTPVQCSLSNIIAEFPWLSSNIVYNPKPLITPDLENQEYQLFFQALDRFETSLFQFNRNDDSISTLRLLGVALPEQDPHAATTCIISQHEHFLTAADYHKLGSLIAAYRFYEILGFQSGGLAAIPKDMARLSMFLPEYYSYLLDWPKTVDTFRTIASKTVRSIIPTKRYSIPMISLLKMVEDNAVNTKFLAIAENFLLMAIHMATFKHVPFKPGSLPDLPSTFSHLDSKYCGQHEYDDLIQAYTKFIHTESMDSDVATAPIAFRNSFHLAVIISPLYLLTPSRLFKKSFNRHTIIDFASRLGPHKPPTIEAIEKLIWDSLFKLSNGNVEVGDVLRQLATLISQLDLDKGRHSQDEMWFKVPPHMCFYSDIFHLVNNVVIGMHYVRIDQNALVNVNRSMQTSLDPTSPPTANTMQSSGYNVVPNMSSLCTIHSPLSPIFNPYFHIPPLPTTLPQLLPYGLLHPSDPPCIDQDAMDVDPPLLNNTISDMLESQPSCSMNIRHSPSPNKVVFDDNPNFTSDGGGNSGITALPNLATATSSHSNGVDSMTSDDMILFPDLIPVIAMSSDALGSDQTIGTAASPFVDGPVNPVEDDFPEVSGGRNTLPTDHDYMHIDSSAPSFDDGGQTPVDYSHDFDVDGSIDNTHLPYSPDTHDSDFQLLQNSPNQSLDASPLRNSLKNNISSALTTSPTSSNSPRLQAPPEGDELLSNHPCDEPVKHRNDEVSSASTTLLTSSNPPSPQNHVAADDDSSGDELSSNNPHLQTVTPEPPKSSSEALKHPFTSVEDRLDVTPGTNSSQKKPLVTTEPDSDSFHVVCTADAESSATPPIASIPTSTLKTKPGKSKSEPQKPLLKTKKPISSDSDEDTNNIEIKNIPSASQAPAVRSLKRPSPPSVPLRVTSSQPSTLGTASNPITVNDVSSIFETISVFDYVKEEKPNLPDGVIAQNPGTKKYTLFDSKGAPLTFVPRFHYKEQLSHFHQFMQSLKKNAKDGQPPHIVDRQESVIATYSYVEWTLLDPGSRQKALSTKNIVVADWPIKDPVSFDKAGLCTVAGWPCQQISIQDYSISPDDDNRVTVCGHVQDIWDNRGPDGKILNALDLPMFQADTRLTEYGSDLHAWDITRGIHCVSQKANYQTEHMHWALVGLKNTMTYAHVDCDGLSTYIHVLCGRKIWGFLREHPINPVTST